MITDPKGPEAARLLADELPDGVSPADSVPAGEEAPPQAMPDSERVTAEVTPHEPDFGPEPWESAPPPPALEPAPAVERVYGAGAPPEAFADGDATQDQKKPAYAVYLLYLAAFVLAVPALLGVWLAYSRRMDAPEWLTSHYVFQIRTFWIGLAAAFGGVLFVFLPFGLGPLILMAVVVWVTLRCFVGMVRLHRGEPIYNPQTWIA